MDKGLKAVDVDLKEQMKDINFTLITTVSAGSRTTWPYVHRVGDEKRQRSH